MVREVAVDSAALWDAKIRAELVASEQLLGNAACVAWTGSLYPVVALVKGEPGPVERAGGGALSGPDGEAAVKALAALGVTGPTWRTLSRPTPGIAADLIGLRLRQQLCAVDPDVVVALDREAAADLALAFGVATLTFGEPVAVGGMKLIAVDGMEASLADGRRKREVWQQFQGLTHPAQCSRSERDARRRPVDNALF